MRCGKLGRHPTISLDQNVNTGESEAGRLVDLLTSDEAGPAGRLARRGAEAMGSRRAWTGCPRRSGKP